MGRWAGGQADRAARVGCPPTGRISLRGPAGRVGAHAGLVHLYNTTVAGCSARGDCQAAISQYLDNDSTLRTWLGVLVVAGPGLLGLFWGAPLVARELEAGTFRLAWTQSVTRTRWLVVKLALGGWASMTAAGLLSLIVTWWASPLDRAHLNIFNTFDERDIVPIGFALFAFVRGVFAGLIIHRTLPAMAATLVVFVGPVWPSPNGRDQTSSLRYTSPTR